MADFLKSEMLTEVLNEGGEKKVIKRLPSTDKLLVAIKQGFMKCINQNRGQQLVDLLKEYQTLFGGCSYFFF